MKEINRSIFILSVFGVLLLSPGVHSADLTQDCLTRCADEKTADDMNCPAPAESIDQGRVQCLKNNQDIYNNCHNNCLPISPPSATTTPSVTPGTPSVPTPSQGTTPHQGIGTTPPQGNSFPKAD